MFTILGANFFAHRYRNRKWKFNESMVAAFVMQLSALSVAELPMRLGCWRTRSLIQIDSASRAPCKGYKGKSTRFFPSFESFVPIVQCRRPPLLLLQSIVLHSILLLLTAQVSPCEYYAFVSRFRFSRCRFVPRLSCAHTAGVCRALATGIIFNCTFAFTEHKSAANRISNDRKNNRPMPPCNWSWNLFGRFLLFAALHSVHMRE